MRNHVVYSFFSKAVATSNDFFKNLKITIEMSEIYLRMIQVMYSSEFGSYSFGKKCIYHLISHAMRVLKMYILSKLEILKVRTILGTLCVYLKPNLFDWELKANFES